MAGLEITRSRKNAVTQKTSSHLKSKQTGRKWLVIISLLLVIIFLSSQWDLWQTGRDDLAPLPLFSGGPKVEPMSRIWIDTDAACGATARTDPDDCFAILWLVSRRANIVGISTSFGNASGEVVQERVATLAANMTRGGLNVPPVFYGHARPPSSDAQQPPGVIALREALESGPLTILALGPLTNIAAALKGRPGLKSNVTRIVAVMGHQQGHLFHPSEGKAKNALLGHGPIFPDLNLSADPASVPPVIAMGRPITLIPYDAARTTLITATDLDNLARRGPPYRWVTRTSRDWLNFWNDVVGIPGFYPFDWVAAAYLTDPGFFDCAEVDARVTREWTFWVIPRSSLVIDGSANSNDRPRSHVLYCPKTDPSLHDVLTKP